MLQKLQQVFLKLIGYCPDQFFTELIASDFPSFIHSIYRIMILFIHWLHYTIYKNNILLTF